MHDKTTIPGDVGERAQLSSRLRPLVSLLASLAFILIFAACEKTTGNSADDAMDQRPAEAIQDAAEDVKDDIDDATN